MRVFSNIFPVVVYTTH